MLKATIAPTPSSTPSLSAALSQKQQWLNNLRIPAESLLMPEVEMVNATVSVGKPSKAMFFRASTDPQHCQCFHLLAGKDVNQDGFYLVAPNVLTLLPRAFVRAYELWLVVSAKQVPSLVPVPLPSSDGSLNSWHASLRAALDLAKTRWARIAAEKTRNGYSVFAAKSQSLEPKWPQESYEELVFSAFQGRVVDSADHPVFKMIEGEEL